MKKKINVFISCDEANHCCDKSQYKEASLLEMIKLNIHLLYCKACRTYTKNNTKLSKLMKSMEANTKTAPTNMNSTEKESLEEIFKKELSNHN